MSKDIFEIINPTNTLGVCRPLVHILGACETIVYNALLSKYRYYQKNDMLDDGWFYSTIPDLFESTSFSAFIVSYRIGTSNNNQLVFEIFNEAVANTPTAHPLFHSDRGFQYTNKTFHNMLMEAGMRQSMSRVGRCIDNGPMEGFWGILKSEMYYLRKFSSKEELTNAIEDYIQFYNTKRYQLKLKCMTPMEYHSAAAA